jgi:hypothetical protein
VTLSARPLSLGRRSAKPHYYCWSNRCRQGDRRSRAPCPPVREDGDAVSREETLKAVLSRARGAPRPRAPPGRPTRRRHWCAEQTDLHQPNDGARALGANDDAGCRRELPGLLRQHHVATELTLLLEFLAFTREIPRRISPPFFDERLFVRPALPRLSCPEWEAASRPVPQCACAPSSAERMRLFPVPCCGGARP